MLKFKPTHLASRQVKSLKINTEQLRLALTKWTDDWLSIRKSGIDDVTRLAEERIHHTSMLSRSYGRVLYMANQLTRQDVNRIAELAHLQLSNEEAELFTRQLSDILRYAERLQEVDTTTVETNDDKNESVDQRRKDQLRPSLSRDDTLKNAPDSTKLTDQEHGGYFRVPRVIG